MKKKSMILIIATITCVSGYCQDAFGGYMNLVPPENEPKVFELSTEGRFFAGDRIAISKDGREIYYTEVTTSWSNYRIRCYTFANNEWSGSSVLFPGFLGPALSVDDQTMYFEKYKDSHTCWQSKRTDSGWSAPTLCSELPEAKDKHYLQVTQSGRIFASSESSLNGLGEMDIGTYFKDDKEGAYHSLGSPMNSAGNEGDFYVARDESFIVFASPDRAGEGGADLFISFRKGNGDWSNPRNLGATINTSGYEFGPYVTDDHRFLFFSRSADFGRIDVYWVRFDKLLEELRE